MRRVRPPMPRAPRPAAVIRNSPNAMRAPSLAPVATCTVPRNDRQPPGRQRHRRTRIGPATTATVLSTCAELPPRGQRTRPVSPDAHRPSVRSPWRDAQGGTLRAGRSRQAPAAREWRRAGSSTIAPTAFARRSRTSPATAISSAFSIACIDATGLIALTSMPPSTSRRMTLQGSIAPEPGADPDRLMRHLGVASA